MKSGEVITAEMDNRVQTATNSFPVRAMK